jgi:hypothetical protein
MALFNLVVNHLSGPLRTYEGDYMEQNGEYVKIFKRAESIAHDVQVAAIHLEKNHSVIMVPD